MMTGVMEESVLRKLLADVRARRRTIDQAVEHLKRLPFEDLGFAKVDHHRAIRCGFPEVVYSEGKRIDQVVAVVERRLAGGGNLLVTRASPLVARAVKRKFRQARYNEIARTITVRQTPTMGKPSASQRRPSLPPSRFVAIVCAGTADMPVAEEARETCELMGQPTRQYYDVGVAGIHRLLAHAKELSQAQAVVVCAGMEGALPSVVGGLVACPVVAVPTSVGYGASFGGIAPLLTMLNSCAAGVSVVNIDNGFGAGYMAALICRAGTAEASRTVKTAGRSRPRAARKSVTSKKKQTAGRSSPRRSPRPA